VLGALVSETGARRAGAWAGAWWLFLADASRAASGGELGGEAGAVADESKDSGRCAERGEVVGIDAGSWSSRT
jgi:hypothetical protein